MNATPTPANVNAVLNRLLVLHHRSLLMYLGFARPWRPSGQEAAEETLRMIVQDQQQTVDRLGSLILERGGEVRHGEFPMEYTALHDLSADFLLGRMVTHQRAAIAEIECLADQLDAAPLLQAVAHEILGQAKAHLESLEELAGQRAVAEA